MWNKSISLPIKKTSDADKDGYDENTAYEFLREIPANFTDATRNDEMLASQFGYKADQNIEIMSCNYNGQSFLIDEDTGQEYKVRRTHEKDKTMTIILTCERREAGR